MERQLTLTEQEINELLQALGEIPAKYSLDLINAIRNKYHEQNKEEDTNDID